MKFFRKLIVYILINVFLFFSLYNRTTFSIEHLLKNSYCTCNHTKHSTIEPSLEDAIFEKHKQIAIIQGDLSGLPTCHSVKNAKLPHICDSKKASKSYFEMCRFLFQEALIVYSDIKIQPAFIQINHLNTLTVDFLYIFNLIKPPKLLS